MQPEIVVLRFGYFMLFVTLVLMTWAFTVRAEAFPFQSSGPNMAKGLQGTVQDDYSRCPFNPLCTCSNPGPTDFGIVSCRHVPFAKPPETLKFSRAFVLSMVDNGLDVLEDRQLTGSALWRLEIRDNKLSSIDADALIGLEKSLYELDLENNELTHIPALALRRLLKLRLLNLGQNKITDLSAEDFQGLQTSLTCLSLADNLLVTIPEAVFANLPKLERLDLRGNSLRLFKSSTFIGNAGTLTHLHLADNLFFKIPFEALSPIRLQHLDLSHNMISSTYDPLYQGKINVERLLLTHNRIYVLEPFSLQNIRSIEHISLEGNPISVVNDDAFKEVKLKSIDLSNCAISHIEPKALQGLQSSLEKLDLSFNNISALPEELFDGFEQLHTVNLDENILMIEPNQLESLRYTLQKLSLIGDRSSPILLDELRVMRNLRNLNISFAGMDSVAQEMFDGFGPAIEEIKISRARLRAIKNQAFLHIPGVKKLDLSSNLINRIDNDAFQYVGHSLLKLKLNNALKMAAISPRVFEKLTALKELDLSGNGLNSIPEESFVRNEQLAYLNLRFNQIGAIGQHLFEPLIRLHRIYLSFNLISRLADSTFARLKDLELIEFNENLLTDLEQRCFVDLPNLRILNLAGNQLKELKDETFQNLPKLQTLDLSFNRLTAFNIEAFEQLGTLSHFSINLSHNRIPKLVPGPETSGLNAVSSGTVQEPNGVVVEVLSLERERIHSPDLPPLSSSSIERIDLSHNNISYISPHFFSPIGNTLLELDLSHNGLVNLSKSHLDGMRFLNVLHLKFNRLESIDYDTFRDVKSLQMIFLDNNELRDLTPDLFEDCTNLRVFSAANNRFLAVTDSVFKNSKLEILDLHDNYLVRFPEVALGKVANTLAYLDLSGSRILSVSQNQIAGLKKLRHLNLADNRIAGLGEGTFDNLTNLLYLDLSGNALGKVSIRWFEEIKFNLLHLHLSNLSLETLPDFDQFRGLLTFNASYNQLSYLPTNFGVNVSTLRTLDISYNVIPAPPNTIWHTIPRLTKIIMNDNPIHALTNDSFFQLERLQVLDISNFPLEAVQVGVISCMVCLKQLTFGPLETGLKPSLDAGVLIQHADALEYLHLKLDTTRMITELQARRLPLKLANVTLSGPEVLSLAPGALAALQSRSVRITIENTGLLELPEGFLQNLGAATELSISILENNPLLTIIGNPNTEYRPEAFVTFLESLYISDEVRLSCTCDAGWIEYWLRYWMDKTCPISSINPKADLKKCNEMLESLRAVYCRDKLDKTIMESFVSDLECGWESLGHQMFGHYSAIFGIALCILLQIVLQ